MFFSPLLQPFSLDHSGSLQGFVMRISSFFWLLLLLPFACNPPATFPNENPPTSCQNDTSCPQGQRCFGGICVGSQTEGLLSEEAHEVHEAQEAPTEAPAEAAPEPRPEPPPSEFPTEPSESPLPTEPTKEMSAESAAESTTEAIVESPRDGSGSEIVPETSVEIPVEAVPEIDPDRPAYCTGTEVCFDAIDNDCDGTVDEGCQPCVQSSCPKDTFCSAGKCVFPPCATGTCPAGLLCKTSPTGAKQCAPCASSPECGAGQVCDKGLCVKGDCLQTPDCKGGKICKARQCSPCTADAECSASQICEGNACRTPDCKTSADCQAGKPCLLGRCRVCTQDSDCGAGKLCENQTCIPGQCRTNAQCSGGKVCLRGNCDFCAASTECDPHYTCNVRSGLCTPSVVLDQGAYRWANATYAGSCQGYRTPPASFTPAPADGIYWIKPASGAPFKVHCFMTLDGGGWTLALKIRGDKGTFGYGSGSWTNTTTLSPDKPDFDFNEAKLESFSLLAFTQILVYMRELDTASGRSGFLVVGKQASSLQSVFATNTYQPFSTPAGRTKWAQLNNDFSLQAQCNREGFNAKPDITGFSVRFGILGNDQGSCNTPDSFVGLGGDYTVGGASPAGNQEGFSRRNRMGYLYVR